jgi:UDP-N-acetylmuramoyl-L-alanyl-D-glutamate--2,6-diaminopimelate ligase
MEEYLEAKKLILRQLKGPMIVNSDDMYASEWINAYPKCETLGRHARDYQILNFYDTEKGTFIKFAAKGVEYEVETNLRSTFNVYNYMTALSLINNLGFDIKEIIKVTPDIYPPKGRCEQIKVKNGEAVIDYAHTPDAVEKIIDAFTENKKGRIITIVGCGGDRDPKKRPIMGRIAAENSDYVIFTNDNPRTEDPDNIMKDILAGVETKNYEVEQDRRKAIEKALDMIEENDTVLILGKGHEDYQIIGHEKTHLDDAEEVQKYIDSHK